MITYFNKIETNIPSQIAKCYQITPMPEFFLRKFYVTFFPTDMQKEMEAATRKSRAISRNLASSFSCIYMYISTRVVVVIGM